MKRLLILGAGTAGTMMANKLNAALDPMDWEITIVDENETHYYQPGFLFIPFGIYKKKDVIKPKRNFLPSGVKVEFAGIEVIEPEKQKVSLNNGKKLSYDYLIIATGCDVHPEETEGMEGDAWKETIFDFYTVEGATALARFFKTWEGGSLDTGLFRPMAWL